MARPDETLETWYNRELRQKDVQFNLSPPWIDHDAAAEILGFSPVFDATLEELVPTPDGLAVPFRMHNAAILTALMAVEPMGSGVPAFPLIELLAYFGEGTAKLI